MAAEHAKGVVVVTGAASGIGKQLAIGLAREWTVVTCDLPERMPEIEALAAEHGTVAVAADVAKSEDVEALFAAAGRSGPLRGAVSCAGVLAKAYLSETSPEMFDHLVDVNFKGNFL